jgi:Zincin-like metallopeptidase
LQPGRGRGDWHTGTVTWHPYLPEPRPAVIEPGEPEPVPLNVLRDARYLCAGFRVPPRQFRRRTARGAAGSYYPAADIVAVDVGRADRDGMGGDDGYYATLVHELLHATGHPARLARTTIGDFSPAGNYSRKGQSWRRRGLFCERLASAVRRSSGTRPRRTAYLSIERQHAMRPLGFSMNASAAAEQLMLIPATVGTETAHCLTAASTTGPASNLTLA